jgi:hypothetical protein
MENAEIFEKALSKDERFTDALRPPLQKIADILASADSALLSVFEFYQGEQTTWKSGSSPPLFFEKDGGAIIACVGAEEIKLREKDFFAYLALVSDVYLPVLPLGSTVRLKQSAFDVMEDMGGYEPEVVVVDRYLAVPEAGIYFPYSGAVYPLGTFGAEKKIYFGMQLVEQVLHEGYTDEKEKAFNALMKEEYILEKGLHSLSFANDEEAEVLQGLLADAKGEAEHG